MMKISVIIPIYNEEKVILDCLESLKDQSFKDFEIILVDDGSTDLTVDIINSVHSSPVPFRLFHQKHQGPGIARNLGVKHASGEILVFVDADMIFDEDFLKQLTKPIREGKERGTFSKEEFVINKTNIWSQCWNINRSLPVDRMHPENYPDTQKVFRAILKKEFEKTKGFKPIGYVDDYTISDQLGFEAIAVPNAIFYHRNPEGLSEIWNQARWIGKSDFKKRKIKNESIMKVITLIRYSLPFSLMNGTWKSFRYQLPQFLIFKIIYDLAIEVSVVGSFFGEQKYK